MLEGVLAPGRHGQRGRDPRLQAGRQDRHGQKPDPATGGYSDTKLRRLVRRLRARRAPEAAGRGHGRRAAGRDLRRHRRRARRSGRSCSFALPYLRHPARARRRARTTGRAPPMKLSAAMLLGERGVRRGRGAPTSRSPTSPTTVARRARPATLFFCVPGFTRDGHDFAPEAVARGAAALVVERPLRPRRARGRWSLDARAAMAPGRRALPRRPDARAARRRRHRHQRQDHDRVPASARCSRPPGASTRPARHRHVGRRRREERAVVRTTPEAIDLQRDFARDASTAATRPARWRSPRTRSSCDRADAIHCAVGVFTNLTQDHLDFHPTMEDYFPAKRRLFDGRPAGGGVVNVDDPYGRRLADELAATRVTFGVDAPTPTTARPTCAAASAAPASRFTRRRATRRLRCRCRAASTSPTRSARWPPRARSACADDAASRALPAPAARARAASSRSTTGQDFAVLVDYAHTPDSLENVLRAARRRCAAAARVLVRLRRRRRPRPRQAPADGRDRRAASPTSSSSPPTTRARRTPRRSSPRSSAGTGARAGGRRSAMVDRRARDRARGRRWRRPGDVVVIAGKGHEQGQEFAGGAQDPVRRRRRSPGRRCAAWGWRAAPRR